MDIIKIIGAGLIGLIIIVMIKQYKPEFTIYVSIITGVIILWLTIPYFRMIIDLLNDLSSKASINTEFIKLLIKITGIAYLTEFAVNICKDTGETSIANKIDVGGKVIIAGMSMPIITSLFQTMIKVLP